MLGGVAEKPHKVIQIRNERFRDTFFVRFDASVGATDAAQVDFNVRSVDETGAS
jgi:hypothetical protein